MKQEVVAQKILGELVDLTICTEKNEDIVWEYLLLAYAAGFDEGRKQHAHRKPVGQYSIHGDLIKIWDSVSLATKHFGLHKTSISKAALGRTETCVGFRWKFVDITKPSSKEKIKPVTAKSVRPKPRTHFSKKGRAFP